MKYLIAALIFISTSAFANIPIQNIDHTTIMTKDTMFVLDKRAGKFWKVETGCELPIDINSNVKFVSSSRIIKEGTQVTFVIDTLRNKHRCSIQKISSI
jgi:hypothetical protein